MRETARTEVAMISADVARQVFTHSNLLAEVSREVHARLPETIRLYAEAALPSLAGAAVALVTPNAGDLERKLRTDLLRAFVPDTRDLVTNTANELMPGLAETAVREAAPDPAAVHTEVVDAASAKLTELIRVEVERAVAVVVERGSDQVATNAAKLAEEAARPVVTEAVTGASARLAAAADTIRADLEEKASAAVIETAHGVAGEAATKAVRAAVDGIHEAVTEIVTGAADGIVPKLARGAVDETLPDIEQLREAVTGHAEREAAGAVDRAARRAMRDITAKAAKEALGEVKETLRSHQEQACAAIAEQARVAVDAKLAEFTPNVVQVVLPSQRKVDAGVDTHEVLPELLVALHARCHVLLVGPAGTGKSMLAKHAAAALDLPLHGLSLGPTTPMSKVFGYFDAHGKYHDTPFRRAFEHGGVMLLDELDNGHPGLLAELNQALALGTCAFADGMVDAHEDFRLVATGNTYGTGADRQYVGRQSLDAATLDRFVVIDVPIDEGLEERIALRYAPSHPDEARDLLTRIRGLRKAAAAKNIPVLFSPRASIDSAKLLEAGADVEQVMQWRVVRGLPEGHRKALGLD